MKNQQQKSPTNITNHIEAKLILDSINPEEFNILDYIKKLEDLKNRNKKEITWANDEWDNWHGAF